MSGFGVLSTLQLEWSWQKGGRWNPPKVSLDADCQNKIQGNLRGSVLQEALNRRGT